METRPLQSADACSRLLLTVACGICFGPQANGQPGQTSQLAPGKAVALSYPKLGVDRTGSTTTMRVRLPDRYSPEGQYPLIVWLGGGSGKPNLGPPMKLVDRKQWVVVSLPYPRGANDRYQSNMVGNFPRIWQYHRVMLTDLLRRVPNISAHVRYVAGFSNGGHCIDGLLAQGGHEPASFYSGFILVDGGGARGTRRYSPAAAGKPIYVLWGGRSPMRRYSPNVLRAARTASMAVSHDQMEGVGHAFPKQYKQQVSEWIVRNMSGRELLGPPVPREVAVGLSIKRGAPMSPAEAMIMRRWLQRNGQWFLRNRSSRGAVAGSGPPPK